MGHDLVPELQQETPQIGNGRSRWSTMWSPNMGLTKGRDGSAAASRAVKIKTKEKIAFRNIK